MNTFKNIYKALVAMTVISITVLCLNSIGVIDLGLKVVSNEIDETGLYVLLIAISILLCSFIFSRAANVIANRKNTIIAYFTVFLTLIVLLFVAVTLIFKLELNNTILQMLKYILIAILYLTVIILVFEIPQSNNSHGKFQIFTVCVITIAFILNLTVKDENTLKISSDLMNNENITDMTLIEDSDEDEEKEDSSIMQKAQTVFNYLSLGLFIINPMLRVLYLDKDYSEEASIDDIITNSQKNNLNNSTQYSANEKYRQQVEAVKKKQQTNKSTPQTNNVSVQEVHEKVINPNFKQDDMPEAIIPTITGIPNSVPNDNTAEQTPSTPVVTNEPVVQTSPIEQPVVNQAPPTPTTEQVPTTPIVNNEPVIQTSPIEQLIINQAPPTDINPNNTNNPNI